MYRATPVLLVLAVGAASACEREDCDRALEVVCSCDSRPCEANPPPPIVQALRRCDSEDVRPDNQEGNVHLCIQSAGRSFCAVLDGLATQSQMLCEADCRLHEASCTVDLEQACQEFQYGQCDLP